MPDYEQEWTTLHDLSMVYLALAHGTDAHLSDEELAVMTQRLNAWAPELHEGEIRVIVMEALAVYLEGDRDAQVGRAMLAIRRDVDLIQRFVALGDLVGIAEADGVVLASERGLIQALQRIWGLGSKAQA